MAKVIVLGAGRVGGVIARDLNEDENIEVTVVDRRQGYLDRVNARTECKTVCQDLADYQSITELVKDFDVAVDALPGAMGLETMKAVMKVSVLPFFRGLPWSPKIYISGYSRNFSLKWRINWLRWSPPQRWGTPNAHFLTWQVLQVTGPWGLPAFFSALWHLIHCRFITFLGFSLPASGCVGA